jgi:hypothetical protein
MKNLYLLIILSLGNLAQCQLSDKHEELPNDSTIGQRIVGTWVSEEQWYTNHYRECVITLSSNGSLMSRQRMFSNAATNEWLYEGIWQIKDGVLIETITKVSGPTPHEPVGEVSYSRIVAIDHNKLIYNAGGQTISLKRKGE